MFKRLGAAHGGITDGLARFMRVGVLILLAVVPLQTPAVVWLGSHFGHLDLFRIWSELLLFAICLCGIALLTIHKRLRNRIFNDWLYRFMFAFCIFLLIMTLVGVLTGRVSSSAAIYGLFTDGRLYAAFLAVAISRLLGMHYPRWLRAFAAVAAIVVGFGLLQIIALPPNFLGHFGYGPHTIPAYQTVDSKSSYVRIQSTLRGPNPLGAYLVVVVCLLATYAYFAPKRRRQMASALLASGVVLYATYSRSAWLGAIVAVPILFYLILKRSRYRSYTVIMGALLVLVLVVGAVVLRNNDAAQNVFFHTNEHSLSQRSSNDQRLIALRTGVVDVVRHPLGRGAGSAGPASVRNTSGPVRISENFFVQLAQETGMLGLGLFLTAYIILAYRLWERRAEPYHAALLASLVGLTAVSMVSHAWSDDVLAYTWWIIAGIVLTNDTLSTNKALARHERQQKTQIEKDEKTSARKTQGHRSNRKTSQSH